jgi:glycosyltransferase involved in cell wall biosynthesis
MIALSILSTVLLLAMLAVALWNLAAAPRLERAGAPRAYPPVSVLVPARNEADNLKETLPALLRSHYPALEILVLDDASEDDTAAVVTAHLDSSGGRLRLLRGTPLPEGWLGKAWACHQLANAAGGEILVFCDADVTASPGAVAATVAVMQEAAAAAATVIPRQRLKGLVETAVVPLVAQLPVLALLPLPLVPRVPSPALSMGNGQWFAFTREAYDACGGHAAVRAEVVEDVALARRVKAAGHRLLPLVSTRLLHVRMYRGASSVVAGFEKNLYALAGGRPAPFAAAVIVFVMTGVYPWVGTIWGVPGAPVALAGLAAVRLSGAFLFRHGIGTVLLHPPGSIVLVIVGINSYLGARRGTLRWKGRTLGGQGREGTRMDEG